jgi:hypothetical protein
MSSSRGFSLALAFLCILSGRSQACWRAIPPGELVRRSPVIVTGTIVRIDPGAAGREWGGDVAHVRIDVVHRNALNDVTVEPGGTLLVCTSTENTGLTIELRYPVGTRAVWFAWVDEDGSLSIDHHPSQHQPIDPRQALPRQVDDVRYSRADWYSRLERADRWESCGRKIEYTSYQTLATLGLWDERTRTPTCGAAFLFGIGALFGTLVPLLRFRRRKPLLLFPASIKRL